MSKVSTVAPGERVRSAGGLPADETMTHARRVLDTAAAASYIGLSPITLRKMRWRGEGPEFVKLTTARVGYLVSGLDAWLCNRPRYKSTAQHKASRPTSANPTLPPAA